MVKIFTPRTHPWKEPQFHNIMQMAKLLRGESERYLELYLYQERYLNLYQERAGSAPC